MSSTSEVFARIGMVPQKIEYVVDVLMHYTIYVTVRSYGGALRILHGKERSDKIKIKFQYLVGAAWTIIDHSEPKTKAQFSHVYTQIKAHIIILVE